MTRWILAWLALSFALPLWFIGATLLRERIAQWRMWWRESEQIEAERIAYEALDSLDPHRRRRVLTEFNRVEFAAQQAITRQQLDAAERHRASFDLVYESAKRRMADDKAIEALLASCGMTRMEKGR